MRDEELIEWLMRHELPAPRVAAKRLQELAQQVSELLGDKKELVLALDSAIPFIGFSAHVPEIIENCLKLVEKHSHAKDGQ